MFLQQLNTIMSKIIFKLTLLLFIGYSSSVLGQHKIKNSILLQLKQGDNPKNLLNKLKRENSFVGHIKVSNIAKSPLNIWKLEVDERHLFSQDNIRFLYNIDKVQKVQYNHKISDRIVPNDNKFSTQWSLVNTGQTGGVENADIDADLAWDLTTGGLTKDGDTIVICVIDNGIDFDHEDLQSNLWVNYREIPNNGIDDDNNGYVDDYYGWNTVLRNDNINGGGHGTSVAGIIGAKGNNQVGVSGINWNVKMMIILKGNDESDVIEAYSYAYNMRKMYNDSHGTKGAFIVSTNASWGVNRAKAEDYPIWCSMYNQLGSVGIINIGATSNANYNVDEVGDMPSTCASDYLISVTNIDKYNEKVNGAGFGAISIDLGAYGKESSSTGLNNKYVGFGGTSAATPHVTGVTGLIYAHSAKLSEIKFSNPKESCLVVKEAILNGVVKNETIKDKTVSEGVLNAYNSLLAVEKYEDVCAPPVKFNLDTVGADMLVLSWDDFNPSLKYNIKIKDNSENWKLIENIKSPYLIADLKFCSDYYFSLQTVCNNSAGDFGFVKHIKTDGCCDIPGNISSNIDGEKLHIEWKNIFAANSYEIQYKYWSFPVWNTVETESSNIDLDYDFDCGQYVYKIKSNCIDAISEFSKYSYAGDSCLDCATNDYCTPMIDNDFEWINKISINGFSSESGRDINGIGNYSNSTALKFNNKSSYILLVGVDYKENKYNDKLYVWLDANSDGVFAENEQLIDTSTNSKGLLELDLFIPEDVVVGQTRLRVMLSAYKVDDPCGLGANDYGEYEDYCVYLDTISTCINDDLKIDTTRIGSSNAELNWSNENNYSGFYLQLEELSKPDSLYFEGFTRDSFYLIDNLDKCTSYKLFFISYCLPYDWQLMDSIVFKTDCGNAVKENNLGEIKIIPNPVKDILSFETIDYKGETNIEIYSIVGKKVFSKTVSELNGATIEVGHLDPGLYFIRFMVGGEQYIYKMVKAHL